MEHLKNMLHKSFRDIEIVIHVLFFIITRIFFFGSQKNGNIFLVPTLCGTSVVCSKLAKQTKVMEVVIFPIPSQFGTGTYIYLPMKNPLNNQPNKCRYIGISYIPRTDATSTFHLYTCCCQAHPYIKHPI